MPLPLSAIPSQPHEHEPADATHESAETLSLLARRRSLKLMHLTAPAPSGDELDALINEARGLALQVNDTRAALEGLYTGNYRGTDVATRAVQAARQLDNARAALQTSLILQARVTEQLAEDSQILGALADASASATGSLSAQQATNEILAFQAQQAMRLQALLVAQSRAEALERAREMEALAQARAQHAHFFSGARSAHPERPPWN